MPRIVSLLAHWRELLLSLTLVSAYVAALFFNGTNLDVLSLSLALLIVSLGCVLWWGDPTGLRLPKTGLFVSMLLYWAWLVATLAWNPVTYIGTTASFWWQSIFPMAFVIATLMAERARIVWSQLAMFVLLCGAGLAIHGLYQAFLLNQQPRSLFLDANMFSAMLNLIALPTAGYLLLHAHARKASGYLRPGALAAALLLMFYAVMLTRSRGSIVTLIFGLGLIAAFTFRHVPRRAFLSVLVLVFLAYLGAEWSLQGDLTARLGTLSNPVSASPERLLIWQQSWLLLQHSPWWGVGVGLYPLVWARYRDPGDGSAGYFAHNDYLQLWIEIGVPGVVLFLAVLAFAAWLFIRLVRNGVPPRVRIEAAGLIAGLAAIAAHALIEFPFYIAPILIVYGLILARLQYLALSHGKAGFWAVRSVRYFSRSGFRAIVAAAALLPLGYFATVAVSSHEMYRGVGLAEQGRLDEADSALTFAMRLRPDSDSVLVARADLRRHILGQNATLDAGQKATLFRHADEMLAQAEQLNPLRPTTHVIRAELYRLNPALAGTQWRDKVEQFYRAALENNPRFYPARYLYGRFVLDRGDVHGARRILDEGASYSYAEDAQVAPYLLLTAALREYTGDVDGAKALRDRLEAYKAHRNDSITFRPKTPPSLLEPDFIGALRPPISAGTDIDFAHVATPR